VTTVVDRVALDDLYARYVAAVDDGPLSAWPELFVEDCSYQVVARENVLRGLPLAVIRCDSVGMLRDRVHAIESTAFYGPRVVRHLLGPLRAHGDRDGIAVRATFAVYESLPRAATTLLCAGTYDDVVVQRDGGLRFRQKHCIYDGDLLGASIVYPL